MKVTDIIEMQIGSHFNFRGDDVWVVEDLQDMGCACTYCIMKKDENRSLCEMMCCCAHSREDRKNVHFEWYV